MEQYYLPYLSDLGLESSSHLSRIKPCGRYFKMNPAVGSGFYWLFLEENRFGIAISDLKINCDRPKMEFGPAPFLYLGQFKCTGYDDQWELGDITDKSIFGYVGSNSSFKTTIRAGFHFCSFGITLTESFAAEILDRNRPERFDQLKTAIDRFSTGGHVSEISETLQQIKRFRPSPEIARLYYEGKILELISLILQYDENCRRHAELRITKSDLERLEEVSVYLENRFTGPISLNELSRLACMSKSKLSDLFKQVHKSTITDYLRSLRLQKAKDLLLDSDLNIATIADEVGYNAHSNFSLIFRQATGFTPYEYRRRKLQ